MNSDHTMLVETDLAHSVHHFTNLKVHEEKGPLIITKGDGIYLEDSRGNRYIDSLAGAWCTGLGFSEPRLAQAAYKQMLEMPYSQTFAHRTSVPTIELAEQIINIAPEPMNRVFFTCSGSEAIDSAVKFVWYYNNVLGRPEKKKIISRKRAYHGITAVAASVTGGVVFHKGFDLPLPGFLHTETPCMYRNSQPGESEQAFATRLATELENLILTEGAETIGAFFAEPVMGAGGLIPPPATYFEKIQKVLKKHDILFVVDEVICGFCRTGNWFGSHTYDLRPDMVTCAKQLTSGYLPIAGVMMAEQVYQALKEGSAKYGVFGTGYTYGGHPVPAAVALETIKIYHERDMLAHVRSIEPQFQQRVKKLGDHPMIGDARGVGLLGGLELVTDKQNKTSFDPAVKAGITTVACGYENGVILRNLPGDVLGLCPPLIIQPDEIDEMFDRIEKSLDDALAKL